MHASLHKHETADLRGVKQIAVYYTTQLAGGSLVEGRAEDLAHYYSAGAGSCGPALARWWGGSCGHLGLQEGASATEEQLTDVLQRLDPRSHQPLPDNGGRKAKLQALDLTFAVPKELSLLWMVGDATVRDSILESLDAAVGEALHWIERDAAVVRRGRDGLVHKEACGLVAVETDHVTSRPVEGRAGPHLHRHVLILNTARGPDGAWTALDAARLYNAQAAAGAIAGQVVRGMTAAALGIEWVAEERDAARPVWRVAGFDEGLRQRMSLRQKQIFDEALERGFDTSDRNDWAAVQRLTREGKGPCGGDLSALEWAIEELRQQGVTLATIREDLVRGRAEVERAREDRALLFKRIGPAPDDRLARRDWMASAAQILAIAEDLPERRGPSVSFDVLGQRVMAAMSAPAGGTDQREVMRAVGRQRSTWHGQDLVRALCDAGTDLASAELAADRYIAEEAVQLWGVSDDLFPEGSRARPVDAPLFASHETLAQEQVLIDAARRGQAALAPLVDGQQFENVIAGLAEKGIRLAEGDDQHGMLRVVLSGGHAVTLVTGQAGTGKSTAMHGLRLAANATGAQVLGAALAANAARNLERETGIESYSIAMLTHRLRSGEVRLEPQAVVLVDECSQASTAQLAELWARVSAVGGRLVLVGDERQLRAVQASAGMYAQLMAEVPAAVARLDSVHRQVDPEERVVLACVHDRGKLTEASIAALRRAARRPVGPGALTPDERTQATLDQVKRVERLIAKVQEEGHRAVSAWYKSHDRVRVHGSLSEAAKAAVGDYWDAVEQAPPGGQQRAALLLARTNAEADRLNRAAIDEGVRRGRLDPAQEVEFAGRDWLVGQRVVGRKVDRRLGLLNGEAGTVVGVRDEVVAWEVTVRWPTGQERILTKHQPARVGERAEVEMTPAQVASARRRATTELARAERRPHAGTAERPRTVRVECADGDGRAVERADQARRRAQENARWATGLPDEGGVTEVEILACTEKRCEPRLVIALDDGSQRLVSEAYAEKDLGGGYAVTTQRGQGQTVTMAGEIGMTYVGMSRARERSVSHCVLDTAALEQTAEDERALLEKVAALLSPGGAEAVARRFAAMESELRARGPAAGTTEQTIAGARVVMAADADILRSRVVGELAEGWTKAVNDPRAPVVVGVAKTGAMVGELNKMVTERLIDKGALIEPRSIGGQTWATLMPVVVTTDAKKPSLYAGETGWVVGYHPDRGLTIELDDTGRQVTLSARQVGTHLSPGFVVTAARARQGGVEAGHFVTVGHGLAEDDLAQMSEHASLELHVEAPDLALARAKERLLDETLLANLERDARVGQRSATQTFAELTHLEERQATERELRRAEALSPEHLAHRQAADCLADLAAARDQVAARATAGLADASELADIDAQVKEQEDRLAVLDQALVSTAPERERHAQAQLLAQARKATERRAELEARLAQLDDRMLGLQSVQEERRMVEAELARDADVPAEDLARRQAEDELIALRHERAGVARAERGPGLEAVGRLAELDQKIAEAMDKLHLLTDRQQRLGPTEEVERQARREATIAQVRLAEEHRRADAAARLADIDAKLDHWVALRVADALRHAPAYLPPRPAQSTVGPERETALGHWAAQVTEIEHFRARWAVTDPLHPLGPAPRTGGPAEQEWADTAERLGLTAELAAYYGLDQSSRPPARTPEQAKRAAEEMARRGSEKARRRIEQHRLQVAARRSARAKEVDFSLVVA